ncbi:MAG: DTW domain-containing protein [Deltaproteobacteria bacterium]|nr:DTW domain-containing protein [Deltaproteobacteria bacterium]
MAKHLCLCSLIPRIETKTKVVMLMHCYEFKKPSNTARLVWKSLPNSEVRLQGEIRKPLNLENLVSPERETLILFPEASAALLDAEEAKKITKPVTLLVPDGTWKQAKKIAAYASMLPGARRVGVPFKEPSRYFLRTADRSDRLCTLEAIARALEVLESPEVRKSLEALMEQMVDRVLLSRAQRRPLPMRR